MPYGLNHQGKYYLCLKKILEADPIEAIILDANPLEAIIIFSIFLILSYIP